MNNLIERKWCTKGTVYIEDLTGTAFTGEDGGHTFVISGVTPDGTAVTLAGTVAGAYILPDGSTQPLTGSIVDGKAQVTLDPECYALPGRGQLTIFLMASGQKVAIYGAVLNVARSSTTQVPPAIAADVADLVQDIEEARATIPASYTDMMASLAKNYADLTYPISAGTYAWQDGWMYRAKVDITSAESWTAAHWEKVPLADSMVGELSSLKRTFDELYDDGIVKEHLQMEWYGIAESTGANNTNSKYIRTPGYLEFDGVAIIRKSTSSVMYVYKYASDGTFQSPAKYYNNSVTTIQIASETGYKYRISYAHYPVAEIAYADVPDVAKEFTIEYQNKEIARKTQADTNTNNIALLQSAFVNKQDFSGFTKTTSQIAYENNGVVTIASGSSYSKYTTYKYMLSGITEFKVSCDVKGTVISLCIVCDESDNVLEKIGYFGDNNLHSFENYVFTVNNPNADYVYFVDYNDSNTTLTKYFSTLSPAPKSLSADGRWFNKKIVCFGDSRTWYDGQNYNNNTKDEWKGHACVGYQKTIEKLLGCQTINQGVSGENSISICTRIRAYDFSGADAVLLEGGVNDWIVSPNADIGAIAPIGSTFDTTTVYGAWQSAIEYIMTNYPDVSIYIDTPCIAWAKSSDIVFPYSIAEVKKNVAELYNLPCKDMYKEAGITILNRDYFYVDNVSTTYWRLHFNDYGNAWIGARLAEFIETN